VNTIIAGPNLDRDQKFGKGTIYVFKIPCRDEFCEPQIDIYVKIKYILNSSESDVFFKILSFHKEGDSNDQD